MSKGFFTLEGFGRAFVPEKYHIKIKNYLMTAGIYTVNYSILALLIFTGIIVSLVPYILYIFPYFSKMSFTFVQTLLYVGLGSLIYIFLGGLIVSGSIMLLIYFWLDVRIYKRTKEVENVFPEFLQYLAGNLKAGMSFDKALWKSVKPQFGVIADDIDIVAKKVSTGEDVEQALIEFSQKYDSPIISRTMDLLIEGMKGGGQMVALIDKIIDNLNEISNLRDEMRASVTAYVIFISIIVMVVAPGLFALSNELLNMVGTFASRLGSATAANVDLPFTFTNIAVDPFQFKVFSQAALVITSFFASMIVSIIQRGDIKGGFKLIPVFMIVSFVVFGIFLQMLSQVFGFIG